MDTINSVSSLTTPLLTLGQTDTEDAKTRVTKSSLLIKLVMTSPWTITSHTVTHSVHLDKNISLTQIFINQSVLRNVVISNLEGRFSNSILEFRSRFRPHSPNLLPGYLNRQIPTSRILTCVKTPVRPPTDIARPAPMRNILGVSGTMSKSAFILISGATDTQSVTEQRMNPSEMLLVIRNS